MRIYSFNLTRIYSFNLLRIKSRHAKACRRFNLFTVVVTERDHRKKMDKGSENADRKKVL